MRKILLAFLILPAVAFGQAKKNLYLKIHVDTCTADNVVLNTDWKIFDLKFVNNKAKITLFQQDEIVISIDVKVNKMIEEGRSVDVLRCSFSKKAGSALIRSYGNSYVLLSDAGAYKTLKIGSDQPAPDFYIQYHFEDVTPTMPNKKPVIKKKN